MPHQPSPELEHYMLSLPTHERHALVRALNDPANKWGRCIGASPTVARRLYPYQKIVNETRRKATS